MNFGDGQFWFYEIIVCNILVEPPLPLAIVQWFDFNCFKIEKDTVKPRHSGPRHSGFLVTTDLNIIHFFY